MSCSSSSSHQSYLRYNTCHQCKPAGYYRQPTWRFGKTLLPTQKDVTPFLLSPVERAERLSDQHNNTCWVGLYGIPQPLACWTHIPHSKSKIEIRHMFHFTRRCIEAHVCICFVALKVNKKLERMLKMTSINMSIDKVLALARPSPPYR